MAIQSTMSIAVFLADYWSPRQVLEPQEHDHKHFLTSRTIQYLKVRKRTEHSRSFLSRNGHQVNPCACDSCQANETEMHWHLLDLCVSSRVRVGCTMFSTPPLDCKQGCMSSQHCLPFQTFHPAAFVCLNIQWKLLKHHCIRFVMFWTYIWKRANRSSEPRFLCHRYKRWHTLRMVVMTCIVIPSGSAPVLASKRHIIALGAHLLLSNVLQPMLRSDPIANSPAR